MCKHLYINTPIIRTVVFKRFSLRICFSGLHRCREMIALAQGLGLRLWPTLFFFCIFVCFSSYLEKCAHCAICGSGNVIFCEIFKPHWTRELQLFTGIVNSTTSQLWCFTAGEALHRSSFCKLISEPQHVL